METENVNKTVEAETQSRRPFTVRMMLETYVVLQQKAKGRPIGEYLDRAYSGGGKAKAQKHEK